MLQTYQNYYLKILQEIIAIIDWKIDKVNISREHPNHWTASRWMVIATSCNFIWYLVGLSYINSIHSAILCLDKPGSQGSSKMQN